MENLSAIWAPFSTWQFGVACVAILAIIAGVKRVIHAGKPALLEQGGVKAVLASLNLVLGLVVAIPENFLMGTTFGQRVLSGLCAGFLSSFVYSAILKRFSIVKDAPNAAIDAEKTVPTTLPPAP
jgi:uncharacterized membrane protein